MESNPRRFWGEKNRPFSFFVKSGWICGYIEGNDRKKWGENMEQSCFFKVEDGFFQEKEVDLGSRFQGEAPWKIRAMNQRRNEEIWKKSGKDLQRYEVGILVESVIFPRLTDVALQKTYGVYGAENLLVQMLLPGEFQMLQKAVEELNGKRGE